MELRDEVAKIAVELADQILALIDGQRCEWKVYRGYWTSCADGEIMSTPFDLAEQPFCPICGKRIEVKDEG
jgi:hypothetical protein